MKFMHNHITDNDVDNGQMSVCPLKTKTARGAVFVCADESELIAGLQ